MSRSVKKGPFVAPELLKRIEELNKNGDNIKWYSDAGMLTIGYKFELK